MVCLGTFGELLRYLNLIELFFTFQALLTSVSTQLYDATGGRGRFSSFQILVPSSWNNELCLRSRRILPTYAHGQKSDFKVESPHPIYGSQPWAEQYGQCGVPGLSVQLPYPLLVDQIRIDTETRKIIMYLQTACLPTYV